MRKTLLAVALSLLAAPALAQQQPLKLDFHDGLVTVEATSVPIRTILTEWGKVGGTKIVGADRVTGAPLTLKLVDVSEAKALETILRSVAGYMAAPRSAAGAAGPSMYDRILVMATSSAPAPSASRAAPPTNATRRFTPPQRQDESDEPVQEEPDENPPNPPVFTFPQPGQNGNGQVNVPGQMINGVPAGNGEPQNITISPATPAAYPGQMPGMPAGVAQPGMMVRPPQPQQPNQPNMIKPPGGN